MAAPTLVELREWVGGSTPPAPTASDTARLTNALAAATQLIESRCQAKYVDPGATGYTSYPEAIHTAILVQAHRLYDRASSPMGVAGFDQLGNLFRVSKMDPDVQALIGRYLDLGTFA